MGTDGGRGYAKLHGKRWVEGPTGDMVEEEIDVLITALPAALGRTGGECPTNEKGEPGFFVGLGNIKSISRAHATIDWDYQDGSYRIVCLSKNGMTVDKTHFGKDESASLRDESALRIGPCNMYFQLPQAAPDADADDNEEIDDDAMNESDGEGAPLKAAAPAVQAALTKPAPKERKRRSADRNGATYADLVYQAFGSEELKGKALVDGLTSSEVCAWVFSKHPDWQEPVERKKQLQNGVQNVLTRKFKKQDFAPGSKMRGARWKPDPEKENTGRGRNSGGGAAALVSSPAAAPAPVQPSVNTTPDAEEESLGSESADDEDIEDDDQMDAS